MADRVPNLAIYLDYNKGYLLSKPISSGSDGAVFRFQSVSQSCERPPVACKLLRAPVIKRPSHDLFEVPGDVRYPATRHPSLIDVEAAARFANEMYMVITQYCNGGDLWSYLNKRGRLFDHNRGDYDLFVPEVFLWALMADLIPALKTLHCDSDPQIAHGDVHSVNVFLHYSQAMDANDANVMPRFILGDFGKAQSRGHINPVSDKVTNEEFLVNIQADVASLNQLFRDVTCPGYNFGPSGFRDITDTQWHIKTVYSDEALRTLQNLERQGLSSSWDYGTDEEGDHIREPWSDSDLIERLEALRAIYDALSETAREKKSEFMSSDDIGRQLSGIASKRPNETSKIKSIPFENFQDLLFKAGEFLKDQRTAERDFKDSELWKLLEKVILIGAPIRLVYVDPETSHVIGDVDFPELASRYRVPNLPPELANGEQTFAQWVGRIRDALLTGGMDDSGSGKRRNRWLCRFLRGLGCLS